LREATGIDDWHQVPIDEVARVSRLSRRSAKRVLERRQRTRAARHLDECAPTGRGKVQPRHPSRSEREQTTERCKYDEGEVNDDDEIGEESSGGREDVVVRHHHGQAPAGHSGPDVNREVAPKAPDRLRAADRI